MASNNLTFLYLSEDEVIAAGLTMAEVTDLCTQSLREHGLGEVENPPKPGIHPLPNAFIHAMPAWLKQTGVCGIKWVSGFPTNVPKKLPTVVGLIVLNDTTTGFPLAVIDGTYVTGLRTAAVSGVGAKFLARPDSEVLGIVGTGMQGKYNTLVLTHLLPSIKTIKIFDKWRPSIDSYVKEITPVLGDKVKIEVAESCEQALTGADVIVTATGKVTEPLFFEKWVKPGALVLPIHAGGWEPEILTKMDMVVVDDFSQFVSMTESIYTQIPEDAVVELGKIVAGKKSGRQNDQQRIINFNLGLAIHDIIVGSRAVEKAKAKGLGKMLDLVDLTKPPPLPPIQ